MIPVDQTILDNSKGNCWAACLASIFEISLEDVPGPSGVAEDFWPDYHAWLNARNATVVSLGRGEWVPDGYVIGCVMSPRFPDSQHAVVIYNGKVVHDPHPSKASLKDDLTDVVGVDLIFPLDPSKPITIKEIDYSCQRCEEEDEAKWQSEEGMRTAWEQF